jgi:uncharacterized protein (TIGR03790 family)
VLVVRNVESSSSKRIVAYYVQKRGIPADNVVDIEVAPNEEIPVNTYGMQIESVVKSYLRSMKMRDRIDFIVVTKGVPLRIKEGGYSVDAFLATMEMEMQPIEGREPEAFKRCQSPYFGQREHFSKKKYGFYLVTRLDGYTAEAAMKLVDNALAAEPNKGLFLFDIDPRLSGPGYDHINQAMTKAEAILKGRGLDVYLDKTNEFLGRRTNLAGYYSWGSNDKSFNRRDYQALTFLPGAIVETGVSTSARTFWPSSVGQSLIGDLIENGATGAKGYVSEPYSIALCPADILFDRYTQGYNLAESFYMATPFLKWKDVVVGDPLCAPYAK